jgi:hypothetical protein
MGSIFYSLTSIWIQILIEMWERISCSQADPEFLTISGWHSSWSRLVPPERVIMWPFWPKEWSGRALTQWHNSCKPQIQHSEGFKSLQRNKILIWTRTTGCKKTATIFKVLKKGTLYLGLLPSHTVLPMCSWSTLELLSLWRFVTCRELHENTLGESMESSWKTHPGDAARGQEVSVIKHFGTVYFCHSFLFIKRNLEQKQKIYPWQLKNTIADNVLTDRGGPEGPEKMVKHLLVSLRH